MTAVPSDVNGQRTGSSSTRVMVPLLLVAVVAGAIVMLVTRLGPGASGDSSSYLMGAENLLAGNGFYRYSGGYELRPITGFPPMFAVALTPGPLFGLTFYQWGRWLNSALMVVNVLFIGGLVWHHTRSILAAGISQLLFASQASIVQWHSWLMSEPLYIAFSFASIVLLALALQRRGPGYALLSGIAAALATLTRFIGFALVPLGLAACWLLGDKPLRQRVIDSGAFAAGSLVPVGLWLLRNRSAAGTLANRSVIFHGVDLDLARLFLAELSAWFVPHELPLPTGLRAAMALAVAGMIGLALVRLVLVGIRQQGHRWPLPALGSAPGTNLPWLLAGYAVAYLAILGANSLWLDASTSASAVPRYLAPLYAGLVPLAPMVIFNVLESSRQRWQVPAVAGYAMALILLQVASLRPLLQQPLDHIGYAGYKVRWQQVTQAFDQVAEDQAILTNNPELTYIVAGRPAYVRPIYYDHYRELARSDFEQQLELARRRMVDGAVLVIFLPLEQDDLATIEYTGAVAYEETEQAVFYRVPED